MIAISESLIRATRRFSDTVEENPEVESMLTTSPSHNRNPSAFYHEPTTPKNQQQSSQSQQQQQQQPITSHQQIQQTQSQQPQQAPRQPPQTSPQSSPRAGKAPPPPAYPPPANQAPPIPTRATLVTAQPPSTYIPAPNMVKRVSNITVVRKDPTQIQEQQSSIQVSQPSQSQQQSEPQPQQQPQAEPQPIQPVPQQQAQEDTTVTEDDKTFAAPSVEVEKLTAPPVQIIKFTASHVSDDDAKQIADGNVPVTVTTPTKKQENHPKSSLFQKETVVAPKPVTSLFATQLNESGLLRASCNTHLTTQSAPNSARGTITGPYVSSSGQVDDWDNVQGRELVLPPMQTRGDAVLVLKVYPVVDEPPMRVSIKGSCTVQRVIEMILVQYRSEQRQPAMGCSDAMAYELRMLDDEDGSPDEDMDALDRTKDIHEYGVDAVAIVENPDYVPGKAPLHPNLNVNTRAGVSGSVAFGNTLTSPPPRQTRGVSLEFNIRHSIVGGNKFFLKVLVEHHASDMESHVLIVSRDMLLEDLLPIIGKKKKAAVVFSPEFYVFRHIASDTELEMKSHVGDLQCDEVRLVKKQNVGLSPTHHGYLVENSHTMEPSPSQFVFSLETAGAYSEYTVIKTNSRGKKQQRILGVDKTKIYNKHLSTRRMTFDVSRASRPISSITLCAVNGLKLNSFQIQYREKGKLVSREYECETKMESAEIVAKIKFLMEHQPGSEKAA